MSQPKVTTRTAQEIYSSQNTIFHRTAVKLGFPYMENLSFWTDFFSATLKRQVFGLTKMTLGERDQVLKDLAKRCSFKVFNPPVPKSLQGWKKGDPDAGYEMRIEADTQVTKILSIWVDLGHEPGKLRGLVRRMYTVDDVRWLSDTQKTNLIQTLSYRAMGGGGQRKTSRHSRSGKAGQAGNGESESR